MKIEESLITTFFGGPEKLDCWLTRTADQLADPAMAKPTPLPIAIPEQIREWMLRPFEVLDGLLEKLEGLRTWSYTISVQKGLAMVTDNLTNHILEVIPMAEESEIRPLFEKYGPNVEMR
jgi:hypothetical protein